MTKWDGLNRRKFPRINYPCLIVIRESEKKTNVILTHTENIGMGGICVILKQGLKMFSPVDLELDLLDLGDHIKCRGKVVWSVRRKMDAAKKPLFYDIGVEFEDISAKDQERLNIIIQKLIEANNKTAPNTQPS